jgi:hypothetical protein
LQKDKAGAAKLAAERIKVRDGQRMKLQAEVQAVSAAVRFKCFDNLNFVFFIIGNFKGCAASDGSGGNAGERGSFDGAARPVTAG